MGENLAAILLRHAGAQPGALAASADGHTLTYGELAELSGRLASLLKHRRVTRLAILGSRSLGAFVGVLGASWASVTYVPLSLKAPRERLINILGQARCDAILVDQHGAELLDDLLLAAAPDLVIAADAAAATSLEGRRCESHLLHTTTREAIDPVPANPEHPAYIIFTSGTTGSPKGVLVSNGAVLGLLTALRGRHDLSPADRVAETSDLSFDFSVGNMIMAWDSGASLHAVKAMEMIAPARFIRANAITVWCSVPSVISVMQHAGALGEDIFPLLRYSVFGGEALPEAAASAWQIAAPNSCIDNLYGATEGTVHCIGQQYHGAPLITSENGTVSIGVPLDGLEAAILDEQLCEVPPSIRGQLALSGRQVALGYLDQPELTNQRFPIIGGRRWYLTGDAAYRDAGGCFHHLGRLDNQVKVLGYRVELEEVESHLRELCSTANAAVVGWPRLGNSVRGLVGFVVAEPATAFEAKKALWQRIPTYMVPNAVYALHEMPLTSNGKIDRAALVQRLDSGWPVEG